jgi:hypothetical protein
VIGVERNSSIYLISSRKLLGDGGGGRIILFAALRQRLRNGGPQQEKRKCGDGSQRQKRDAIAEVLNQLPAKRSAESCAKPDCCCETALNKIESAGAAGSIRDYEDRDNAKDRIGDAVQDLDRDQALGVLGKGIKNCPDGIVHQNRP